MPANIQVIHEDDWWEKKWKVKNQTSDSTNFSFGVQWSFEPLPKPLKYKHSKKGFRPRAGRILFASLAELLNLKPQQHT